MRQIPTGTPEKALQGHVDDTLPLRVAHPRQRRVVVDAGVVDEDLDRPGGEQRPDRAARGLAIGHVERDRLGAAPRAGDAGDNFLRTRAIAVRMHDHVQPVGGQLPADRATDVAAAAGDECAARWRSGHVNARLSLREV